MFDDGVLQSKYYVSDACTSWVVVLSEEVFSARRKKKKRKRQLEEEAETKIISASSGKGGLSDNDFAALSAGYDPTAGYDPSPPSSGNFDLYGDDSNLGMYDDEPWN